MSDENECNCNYMTIDEQTEAVRKAMSETDQERREELLDSVGREYETRTGHSTGCPTNVAAYKPGEWITNTDRSWARVHIEPMAEGMIVEGEVTAEGKLNRKSSFRRWLVGLYRKE